MTAVADNVIRMCDYDRKDYDAIEAPRESAVIVILPTVRVERQNLKRTEKSR